MPAPKTLVDLLAIGDISTKDLDVLASELFTSLDAEFHLNYIAGKLNIPYDIELPHWRDIPESSRMFIRKALLNCKITNKLDRQP